MIWLPERIAQHDHAVVVLLSRHGVILNAWGGDRATELPGMNLSDILMPADAKKILSLIGRTYCPMSFFYTLVLDVRHKTRFARLWPVSADRFIVYNYKILK